MGTKTALLIFIIIVHEMTTGSRAQSQPDHTIPFGITTLSTTNKTISFAQELGAKTVRLAGPQAIIWDRITSRGWSENDKIISDFYNSGLEISVVVLAGNPAAAGTLDAFSKFVREMAERYDGDGIDDAPGSPVVTYFEIDNEPDLYEPNEKSDWKGTLSETPDYAFVLKKAYEAIKSASPEAKVAIAGEAFAAPNSKQYYDSILTELDKLKSKPDDKFFDAYNFHYYGFYSDYLAGQITDVKSMLQKHGYANTETIVTETATYSGTSMFGGISNTLPYQSETQQAESLVKRYMYAAANGVSKICWFMQHAENGLTSPDGYKLLAYYSFRKMTEILEGCDWKNIEKIQESDGINFYKLEKQGQPVWVAWADSSVTKTFNLTGINSNLLRVTQAVPRDTSGKEVNDFAMAFDSDSIIVTNASIELALNERVVFIESVNITSIEEPNKPAPVKFYLYQNYPNPFSSSTSIGYHLSSSGQVRLEVFDAAGRLISTIVNEMKEAGDITSTYSGIRSSSEIRNAGTGIHAGVYYYRLATGENVLMKKMVVIR